MLDWIKQAYAYLHGTFHDSSVIVWSRVQVIAMSVWLGLQGVDLSPAIHDPKWMMYYVIFSNVVNELLRRRGAEYHEDGSLK
jgi:hypothetical protein